MNDANDSLILPLTLSLLMHGAFLALLLSYKAPLPAPKEQTTTHLVDKGSFEQAYAQIQNNAAKAQAAQVQRQSQAEAHRRAQIQKQERYLQQMQQVAAEQALQIQEQMREFQEGLLAEQQQEQAQADAEKEAYYKSQQRFLEKQETRAAENAPQSRTQTLSVHEPTEPRSSGNPNAKAGYDENANELGAAIRRHIEKHWQTNALSGKVSAAIEVDEQGNVVSVRFDNPNSPLAPTLRQAIANASPILPVVGHNIRVVRVNFSTD